MTTSLQKEIAKNVISAAEMEDICRKDLKTILKNSKMHIKIILVFYSDGHYCSTVQCITEIEQLNMGEKKIAERDSSRGCSDMNKSLE